MRWSLSAAIGLLLLVLFLVLVALGGSAALAAPLSADMIVSVMTRLSVY